MSWDTYNSRLTANGSTERERKSNTLIDKLNKDVASLLSGKTVIVFPPDSDTSREQTLTVMSSDKNNEKNVKTMPGEIIECGARVEWSGSSWLVTDVDADAEIYQSAFIERCNYVLKFKNTSGVIISKNCIISEVSKNSNSLDVGVIITTGVNRLSLTIAKDSDTIKLKRGFRFIVDDRDFDEPTVYEITNFDRVTGRFNDDGVYKFVIKEVNTLPSDNLVDLIPDNSTYVPSTPTDKGGWF